MNREERVKMVKAMEFIARQVNDEEVFDYWLSCGVADGDIEYGDLIADSVFDSYYIEDDNFADLMYRFLKLMSAANKSGGLYCDNIVDKKQEL